MNYSITFYWYQLWGAQKAISLAKIDDKTKANMYQAIQWLYYHNEYTYACNTGGDWCALKLSEIEKMAQP